MWIYIGRRLLQCGIVLAMSSMICFMAVRYLPGSIAYSMYGANAQRLTQTEIERLEATLLGDTSLVEQYVSWITNVFQGRWGFSFSQQQTVSQLMLDLGLPTIVIVVLAVFLTNMLMTCLVLILQLRRGSVLGKLIEGLLVGATIVPGFWIGFLLLWLFAVVLKWFPLYGTGDGSFTSLLYHAFLPSLALSLPAVFYGVKLMQGNLYAIRNLPFFEQLKKRGISKVRYRQHVLPHIALIYLQLNGYLITAFVGGTIAVETVFSLPGLGRLTVEVTKAHDYPTLMMILLFGFAFILLIQLVIDVLSSLIDSRVYRSLKE